MPKDENHEGYLKPDFDNAIYIIVSDNEPITHSAENIILAFENKEKGMKHLKKLKEEENYLEDLVLVTVELEKEI